MGEVSLFLMMKMSLLKKKIRLSRIIHRTCIHTRMLQSANQHIYMQQYAAENICIYIYIYIFISIHIIWTHTYVCTYRKLTYIHAAVWCWEIFVKCVYYLLDGEIYACVYVFMHACVHLCMLFITQVYAKYIICVCSLHFNTQWQ